jgi:translation initiation factor IF-2
VRAGPNDVRSSERTWALDQLTAYDTEVLLAKRRIYQVAKEFRISSEALIGMLQKLGYDAKTHMNAIDDDVIEQVRAEFEKEKDALKREYVKKIRAAREKAKAPAKARGKKKAEEKGKAKARPKATKAAPAKRAMPSRAKAQPASARAGAPKTDEQPARRGTATKPAKGARPRKATRASEKAAGKREAPPRKPRKRRPRIDQKTVEETVRRTMAATGGDRRPRRRRRKSRPDGTVVEEETKVQVPEFSSVSELSEAFDVPANDVIKKCLDLGLMVTINQRLDEDTILLLADEFGEDVEFIKEYGEDILEKEEEQALADAEETPRAPVVVVMGHVDHGKTLLLDYIRSTNVVAGESGGITQHIGAYEVEIGDHSLTFLDTPGHEAFTAMRARGAQVTDIVVLVVAADDGVMPQTLEAIDHARAAGVPVIVALNKIDLPSANPDKVRAELSNHGLVAEEWGGETVTIETSAKTGEGVEKLLDMVLTQAELLELKAVSEGPARGVVVEVEKERGRGVVATVLVQSGTLTIGDSFVVGLASGKVRALYNERGKNVDEAGPSQPVQVSGLNGIPQAGDVLAVVLDDGLAREISAKRSQQQWERQTRFQHRVTLEDLHKQIVEGAVKELRIVIKGDVDGSVGALADALEKLSTEEVKVEVIRKAVGAVTETDVLLAAASNAIIVGFHIGATVKVRELARRERVEIRLYKVIYEAVEDIKAAMEGLLEPEKREVTVGTAEVREIFRVPGHGVIGGCYVLSGTVRRNAKARVIRDEMVIHEGRIDSLKRFKDDVREVQTGFECGIGVSDLDDLRQGDLIEVYDIEEVARKLGEPTAG